MRTARRIGFLLLAMTLLALPGCYGGYYVAPARCLNVWIPAHHGPFGWHRGHWRCV